jgi:hypothetical protein
MHTITFYPLGNADCCFIELENGKNLLFDYAHCKDFEDENDLRVDLKTEITDRINSKEKNYFDIVAFTHADDDHIRGFSDLFYLEYAKKYQNDERIKINELWVPAAVICEKGLKDEGRILQAEARYRLKNKSGIRVFSRPSVLKDWFESEGLEIDEHSDLFVDAGKVVPNLSLTSDNFEVFVHSPFAYRTDDEVIDQNTGSIVAQCVFSKNTNITKLILAADTPYENWIDIVNITKSHNREERLEWDIIKLPHHCSYLSLNNEKGKDKTDPVEEVKWLFEQGQDSAKIISTSKEIPTEDTEQPPHRQAANYYKDAAKGINGEFLVTMEFPKSSKPEPLVVNIDDDGATTVKRNLGAVGIIAHQPARRTG